ncbi:DUF262 domain-containing protein [Candidatus Gracilibacteria bacterium]|nr:DUF262 domain-containing protein [Candidatus Gracilibacteria bacterium]
MSKIYTTTEYNIENLLSFIQTGSIGVPDLQRPFVWKNRQVRELFDSLYNGYPVGFFLFWKTKSESESHLIGRGGTNKIPDKVIIDGQQRLTSLYAVIKGEEVLDNYYNFKCIKLAFNPKTEKIEVSSPAYEKSNEWISDISILWSGSIFDIITDYINKNTFQSENDKKEIPKRIQKLYDIKNISFSALEILDTINIDQVSEIFVRINSRGKKLNQLDFILTLLSVYWEEGRKSIEDFARNKDNTKNKFEHLLIISPGDIIKILVSFTFFKGRLEDIYNLLKGRDTSTRSFDEKLRLGRLEKLQKNLPIVLNETDWNTFFKILIGLGFKNSKTINASNNILFSYLFFLIGKYKFGLEFYHLEKYIGKYYVYLVLSSKYSSSTETTLEKELKIIENLQSGDDFISYIEKQIERDLGNDFWETGILNDIISSSTGNNVYLVYLASKLRENHRVLFSDVFLSDLLDDKFSGIKKKYLDIHHIFPKNYLKTNLAITDIGEVNQVANYVYLNFHDNIKIGDASPDIYYDQFLNIYGVEKVKKGLKDNEIPEDFYNLSYYEFLEQRRRLMITAIKKYFYSL